MVRVPGLGSVRLLQGGMASTGTISVSFIPVAANADFDE